MDPLTVAALIGGAATLLDTGANAASTYVTNKQNYEQNLRMYRMQQKDNEAQWHRVNAYNDPSAVMARLRNAGLNPHLIYGQGSGGGGTASPMPGANAPTVRNEAMKFNTSDSIMNYVNAKQQEAQTNNLRAQNDVIKEDLNLRTAQTASTILGTQKTAAETQQAKELYKYSLQAAEQDVKQRNLDFIKTEAATEQIKAQTKQTRSQTETTELENNLRRLGVNPSDPTWVRALAQFAAGKSIKQIVSGIINVLNQ